VRLGALVRRARPEAVGDGREAQADRARSFLPRKRASAPPPPQDPEHGGARDEDNREDDGNARGTVEELDGERPNREAQDQVGWTNTVAPRNNGGNARRARSPQLPAAIPVTVRKPGVPRPTASATRPRRSMIACAPWRRSAVRPAIGPNRRTMPYPGPRAAT
jgi:hypothetical protein